MAESNIELRVGATVLVAILVLVFGIVFLSESFLTSDTLRLQVLFDQVGGIEVGDAVRVSGVKQGKVAAIDLGDRKVKIMLELLPDVMLYEDASFRVESFGLMGEMQVAIEPGSGRSAIDPDKVHQGAYIAGVGAVMSEAEPVFESLKKIIEEIERIVEDQKVVGPLEESLADLEEISTDLKEIIASHRADIEGSLSSARSAAEGIDRIITKSEGYIDTSLTALSETSVKARALVDRLDRSVSTLENLIAGVESGQGTIGKLVKDDELYNELLLATRNMNKLLVDVRENPKRYVKLEIF